mmetsp:Transcript_33009/g.50562  ORF Transcript_33009/g.50562 Transcript_33009/m.50562 type:complete len:116 (-) Transcript_33009:20-367(-)
MLDILYDVHGDKTRALESQIKKLKAERQQKLAQIEGLPEPQVKERSHLEKVQEVLDLRQAHLKKELEERGDQFLQYAEMSKDDLAELQVLAKKYEKLMYLKFRKEQDIDDAALAD